MSPEPFIIAYDLRDPDAWKRARRHRAFWGRRLQNFNDPKESMWRNLTGGSGGALKRPEELR